MGRSTANRGQIGIQPVPINDLQLQGYVPKTLYVPDDIPVNVAIAAGLCGSETRIVPSANDGSLYVRRNNSTLIYSRNQVHNFIQSRTVLPDQFINDLWFPDGSAFLLYIAIESVINTADSMPVLLYPLDSTGHQFPPIGIATIDLSTSGALVYLAMGSYTLGHHFNLKFTFGDNTNSAVIHIDIEDVSV